MDTLCPPSQSIPGLRTPPFVDASCAPFSLCDGAEQAIVLVHGLTGSPADFKEWAPLYRQAGYDVFVPILPGHGSHVAQLEGLSVRDLAIPLTPLFHHLQDRYRHVHLVGLSYGAILITSLVLEGLQPTTLSLLAPAFHLTTRAERKIRWGRRLALHRLFARMQKKARSNDEPIQSTTYASIPLTVLVNLHDEAKRLRPRLHHLQLPVYHAHGTRDTTTPLTPNHQLLSQVLTDYSFLRVEQGWHVLSKGTNHLTVVDHHLAWLEAKTP